MRSFAAELFTAWRRSLNRARNVIVDVGVTTGLLGFSGLFGPCGCFASLLRVVQDQGSTSI
jgi:hypothetical protein